MTTKKNWVIIAAISVTAILLFAASKVYFYKESRDIAITIDDLPMIGKTQSRFENIVQALIYHKAPAIAFVIANKMDPQQVIKLKRFRDQGFLIGSHSYSHISLRNTPVNEYINDLARADEILSPLMTRPKYFRYPYLAQGKWWWQRRPVYQYLNNNHYVIAPITVDSKDYKFDAEFDWTMVDEASPAFKKMKQTYLDFIWAQTLKAERKDKWLSWSYHSKKQILLMHGNLLNSYLLDNVLDMYEKHGYHFITITEATPNKETPKN